MYPLYRRKDWGSCKKNFKNQITQRRAKYQRCHIKPAKVSKFSADEYMCSVFSFLLISSIFICFSSCSTGTLASGVVVVSWTLLPSSSFSNFSFWYKACKEQEFLPINFSNPKRFCTNPLASSCSFSVCTWPSNRELLHLNCFVRH